MGKKDKRRNKVKRFVQNKQKQDKSRQESPQAFSTPSAANISQIQTIIHNVNTISSSPDDCTITEHTPLNAVTDSYESITPINNSVQNSPPSLPIAPITATNHNHLNDNVQLQPENQLQSSKNSMPILPVPPTNNANLEPVDSINSDIQNVNTIPALDLNNHDHTSTESLRSGNSLSPMRKWMSIALIYLVSVAVGCDLGNTWMRQTKIASNFQQFYHTSQLLSFYVVGIWFQSHFHFNLSIQGTIMIVSILQLIAITIFDWTCSFPLLVMSRFIAGLSLGFLLMETLKFFESIGSVNYKGPFHIIIGVLLASFIRSPVWKWFPLCLTTFVLVSSYVILPITKGKVEIPAHVTNVRNVFLLVGYIVIQFSLIFTKYSYANSILLLIVIPLYAYYDKKFANSESLLFDIHQAKRIITLRIVSLVSVTILCYSLPIYIDVFDKSYTIISVSLFGGLIGLMLSRRIQYQTSLVVFTVDIITLIILYLIDGSAAHIGVLYSLVMVAVATFTMIMLNSKPLQRESHNTFVFETIVILVSITLTDILIHNYGKQLIHDHLIRLISKKHTYAEIMKIMAHSDRSLDWVKHKAPKYALKTIRYCYHKLFNLIEYTVGILLFFALFLSVITN